MKKTSLLLLAISFSFQMFGQEKEPCTSVILKFKNFSFRSHQVVIPGEMSIAAATIGTTTFHVRPGQEMQFAYKGKNYTLLHAGTDDKKVEHYNLNRLIKKRKRELNI